VPAPRSIVAAIVGSLVVGAGISAAAWAAIKVTNDDGRVVAVDVTTPTTPTTPTTNGGPTSTAQSGATTTDAPGDGTWTDCDGLECATLAVPLDYTNPSGRKINLALKRRLADNQSKRIGSLFVNPGGPGVGGTELVDVADALYSQDLLDRFDIVAWDPRGTGQSVPADCFDDLETYYGSDPTPDDPAERQQILDLSRAWADACAKTMGVEYLTHIGTQDSARDIDEIRKLLGEDKISWFGFSYGSELGATYATMFGAHLRATVLDASIDPAVGFADEIVVSSKNQEAILDRILSRCSNSRSCRFRNGGDAPGAYDKLSARLERSPLFTAEDKKRVVGQAELAVATLQAMYDEQLWSALTDALADAQDGDGTALAALADAYLGRDEQGHYEDTIEGLYAISCLDDPGPTSLADLEALGARLKAVAPRTGPTFLYLDPCLFWPAKSPPKLAITGAGAGTVLVVGSTGDPITPLESTRGMAKALAGGTLLIRDGEGHTSYGSGNDCIDSAVDTYLLTLKAPADGTICK
jgi:pimeloyl-ACP methyl ester carboxylesterase